MTAEFHEPSFESILLVEDLFDKLEAKANKEGGRAWQQKKQQRIVASKAIYFYTHPDAERLITEYLQSEPDDDMTEEDLDSETQLDELEECSVLEVQFTAQREADEDNNNEISTSYVVELATGNALEDVSKVPVDIRGAVQAELKRSFDNHIERRNNGEGTADDEDYNVELNLVKRHVFEMDEVKETIKYSVTETYDGDDFSVPFSKYYPDEMAQQDHASHIDSQEVDEMSQLFNELISAQDMGTVNHELPKNIRVAQILAILSILEFGESQNEQEQKTIEDLTA